MARVHPVLPALTQRTYQAPFERPQHCSRCEIRFCPAHHKPASIVPERPRRGLHTRSPPFFSVTSQKKRCLSYQVRGSLVAVPLMLCLSMENLCIIQVFALRHSIAQRRAEKSTKWYGPCREEIERESGKDQACAVELRLRRHCSPKPGLQNAPQTSLTSLTAEDEAAKTTPESTKCPVVKSGTLRIRQWSPAAHVALGILATTIPAPTWHSLHFEAFLAIPSRYASPFMAISEEAYESRCSP